MTDLLEGEVEVGGGMAMTSRNWAADVFREVAEYTDSGSYPHNISAFDFGRAIGRALTNCSEDNAYEQLLRGYAHYEKLKTRSS